MLRLILMRHAKAETPGGSPDYDRSLTARGQGAATLIGRELRRVGFEPQLVLCSTAVRTQQTLDRVVAELGQSPKTNLIPELYNAATSTLIEQIELNGEDAATLLVIGHNPATEDAVRLLASEQGDVSLPSGFPTAALAVVDFEAITWPDIRPGRGRLNRFITPRDLE